jgi:hypothetical protein
MDYLALLLTGVAAGVGAYIASYLKKKGENLATHEDLNKLVEQVSAVTHTTKLIEAQISTSMWDRQKQWEIKRDVYFDVLKEMATFEHSCRILLSTLRAERQFEEGTQPEELKQLKARAVMNWHDAQASFYRAKLMAQLVSGETLTLGPRWTSENRPYVDTSKPANAAEPGQEYLYRGGTSSANIFS